MGNDRESKLSAGAQRLRGLAPRRIRVLRNCRRVILPQLDAFPRKGWSDDKGQDSAKHAVILAVILVIVVGTIRLVGSNANTVFSQADSSIQ
jgi:Flp pilus assembly pilin Flp